MSTHLDDPADSLLGYHLRRVSLQSMADFAVALAPLGLRPADASVLFVIGANPGVTQSQIGRMLAIKRANMTPLVAGLSQRGLLRATPKDGRSHGLRLTTRGSTLCRKARAAADAHDQRFFGALGAADRNRLLAQLRALWHQRRRAQAPGT
jgi:DNA-binding MarR family transcriptional regulator